MAIFDSLGYARFLRDGGVPSEEAETHAEAARRFIMDDLATKTDLQQALDTQSLRITVRVGAMLAGGFGIMTAIIGLLIRVH
jgi:hypothetical protein